MKQIDLSLIPAPGARPEFLAKVQLVDPSPAVLRLWDTVASQLVLEGYTREGWAWKPNPEMLDCVVVSTDGRKKLPGFLDYLKQRTKSCFGRFGSKGVLIVSYIQDSPQTQMKVRLCADCTRIQGCNLQPRIKKVSAPNNSKPNQAAHKPTPASQPRKGGGLLGKLVAAQKRTNDNVAKSLAKSVAAVPKQAVKLRTAQQVFQEFRDQCHKTMLDFDLAEGDNVIKVPIAMRDHTAGLPESEVAQVTMELLKYMVYEAAEEVNEDWVPFKEPSEFMDEVVIAVYKEAPPEVLEEVNKGDLPDEVRGQQKAIQDERVRQAAQAEARLKSKVELMAHQEIDADDDLETLNTNKRDRRTVEDYERERQQETKRSKVE